MFGFILGSQSPEAADFSPLMLPSALPLTPLGQPTLKIYMGNDFCLLPWVSSYCTSVSLRSSLSRVPAKKSLYKGRSDSAVFPSVLWTCSDLRSCCFHDNFRARETGCFNSISWVLWKGGLCLIRGDPTLTLLWNKRKNQSNKMDKICCLPSPSHVACYEWRCSILTRR